VSDIDPDIRKILEKSVADLTPFKAKYLARHILPSLRKELERVMCAECIFRKIASAYEPPIPLHHIHIIGVIQGVVAATIIFILLKIFGVW